MPIFIELHLVCHFMLAFFMLLSIKIFLKTKANLWTVVAASLMFAIIKFLMDFYALSTLWQTLIIFIYSLATILVIHKLEHISKLIVSAFIFVIYYLCLTGLHWVITTVVLNQSIIKANNYYLFVMLGFNFIIFGLFCAVTTYLQAEKACQLTRCCKLIINNKQIPITGFIDTGNRLVDSQTNKPVVVVSLDGLKKHVTSKMFADLVCATNVSGVFKDIKKIEYSTISGINHITVFCPQQFLVEQKPINCLIGVTTRAISYDALLYAECMGV